MYTLFAAEFNLTLEGAGASTAILAVLVLPVFIRYLARYVVLRRRVRAIKARNVVVTQYESPPAIPPAFFGVIVDNRNSIHDMFATLLSLHTKGLLVISYDAARADYLLQLHDAAEQGLMEHETYLVKLLAAQPEKHLWAKEFAVNSLRYHSDFSFTVLKDLQKEGYYFFHKDIESMLPGQYYTKIVLRGIFRGLIKPWNWPALVLSIVFLPFGAFWFMTTMVYYNRLGLFRYRTDKWEKRWPDVAGYYNYLKVVEAKRRSFALTQEKGGFISAHDPYLVAAQLQPEWGLVFSGAREIGGGGNEYTKL